MPECPISLGTQRGIWIKIYVAEVFIGCCPFIPPLFISQYTSHFHINTLYNYSTMVLAPRLSCGDKLCVTRISPQTGFPLEHHYRVRKPSANDSIYISGFSN